jgi:hypothetical protein
MIQNVFVRILLRTTVGLKKDLRVFYLPSAIFDFKIIGSRHSIYKKLTKRVASWIKNLKQTYFYKPFYVFDLRPIMPSMLFAVFRPLKTSVPNDQSSHI